MFKHTDINWSSNTLFIDPSKQNLLDYTLKKINPTNLLVLNSATIINYKTWGEMKEVVNHMSQFTPNLIVSIPTQRLDFNRLKYSNTNIAELLGGTIVEDTIIICQ
jgi:hypothetical protein